MKLNTGIANVQQPNLTAINQISEVMSICLKEHTTNGKTKKMKKKTIMMTRTNSWR